MHSLLEEPIVIKKDSMQGKAVQSHCDQIAEMNLQFLILAKRMVTADMVTAMFRLGISRNSAEMLRRLTVSNIVKLSTSGLLLCGFRLDNKAALQAALEQDDRLDLLQSHAVILMSRNSYDEQTEADMPTGPRG